MGRRAKAKRSTIADDRQAADPTRHEAARLEPSSSTRQGPSRRVRLLTAAALLVATFALYIPSLSAGFLDFDDPFYITENPFVRQGLTLDGVRQAFTSIVDANWIPVTMLSHMLDVELFGMNPAAQHAVAAAIHGANVAMLFLALAGLTRSFGPSLSVAVLFAVHPLRVESVSWLAERKDLLGAFFFLTALLVYPGYARHPTVKKYLAIAALFALGLMAKSMVVTLPCVLLLLDVWPLRRFAPGQGDVTPVSAGTGGIAGGRWRVGRRNLVVLEKLPLLLLAAAVAGGTFFFQSDSGATDFSKATGLTLGQKLANAFIAVWRYVGKTLAPSHLSIFYPHPRSWPGWQTTLAVVAFVGITVWFAAAARRRPYLLVGWLWFVGMLVPVSGLIQVGAQSMADRYTYLPGIGLLIALVWGARDLTRRLPVVRVPAVACLACLLAAFTWIGQGRFQSTMALFASALQVDPGNYLAHHMVGEELVALDRDGEAIAHFEAAIRSEPSRPESHASLGGCLLRVHQPAAAIEELQQAARISPQSSSVYPDLGSAYAQLKDLPAAERAFQTGLKLGGSDAQIYTRWAFVLNQVGEHARAAEKARQALAISPNDPWAERALAEAENR